MSSPLLSFVVVAVVSPCIFSKIGLNRVGTPSWCVPTRGVGSVQIFFVPTRDLSWFRCTSRLGRHFVCRCLLPSFSPTRKIASFRPAEIMCRKRLSVGLKRLRLTELSAACEFRDWKNPHHEDNDKTYVPTANNDNNNRARMQHETKRTKQHNN